MVEPQRKALGFLVEVAAVPAPNLPPLRVLLLDVRPKAAFDAEHLPQALHFYPPCLQRQVVARGMG